MISQKVIKKDSLHMVFAFSAYFMMNKIGSFFVGIFLVVWHERLEPACCENPPLPPFFKEGLGGWESYFLRKI